MIPQTDSPRVTVVVPTYRRPLLLVEALASIFSNSYADFEVLVVNDGAEEDLALAQAQFADHRIKWITRANRLGMLENNLDAFRRARGEYIATLHDDDQWAPTLLSTLVPILESHPDVVVAFADHYIVNAGGAVDDIHTEASSLRWGRTTLREGVHCPFGKLAVIDQSIPLQCAAVFRKGALNTADFPIQVGPLYDLWTSYQLARGGGAAWYVAKRLAFYREHAASQTATGHTANASAGVYCWDRFLKDDALVAWTPYLKRRLAAAEFRLATELLRNGERRAARHHARRAVALDRSIRAATLAIAAYVVPTVAGRAIEKRRRVRV
jgi:glycosyltransferase involved in cell wall biosynthesis